MMKDDLRFLGRLSDLEYFFLLVVDLLSVNLTSTNLIRSFWKNLQNLLISATFFISKDFILNRWAF
jgi:hypothetical protein